MNMHPLLVGSTPAHTINQSAAIAAANPPPAMVQSAQISLAQLAPEARALWKAAETSIPRLAELHVLFKQQWRELATTQEVACQKFYGCSLKEMRNKRYYLKSKLEVTDDSDADALLSKSHESEMRMSLPDPKAPPTKAERQAQLAADIQAEAQLKALNSPLSSAAPKAKPAPSVPRDLIGFPIPKDLLPRWEQRQEVQDRITAASRLRCALEEITNKGHQNPIYGLYDWQGMIRTVGQLQFHLGQCKPEVVCYECDGDYLALKASKGGDGITRHCHLCSDRGFVTLKQWDDYSESKLAIIAKKVEARLAKCKED